MSVLFEKIAEPARALPRSVPLRIADALRQAILTGQLAGGAALRQEEIASAFDVSRVPVREALRLLESEGLVDFHPNRGAVVAEINPEEVADVYTVRAALECAALALSIPLLTDQELTLASAILDEIDEEPSVHEVELNRRFHLALYSRCGRRRLLAEIENYLGLGDRLLRFHFSSTGGRVFVSQDEHRAILALCRAGRVEEAVSALRAHILGAGSQLQQLLCHRASIHPAVKLA